MRAESFSTGISEQICPGNPKVEMRFTGAEENSSAPPAADCLVFNVGEIVSPD
jgi:hypothetical protein